ncbi:Bel1-like homeodomain protein [Thalictrum thalictroides]|uniref:Bel1-like homeodomain protein n=1 Tax=Thalictrum thalictroides TaxID=46969 RepID=A0A7J6W5L7_THATH|nr:Bel1-like homeodomain protein [Thalictrum thalictroides]
MSERFESGYLNNQTTSYHNSAAEEINIFRTESHVAQQRRRDKLRNISQSSASAAHHLLQLPSDSRVNPDYNNTAMFSSDMLNFSMNKHHPMYAHSREGVTVARADQSVRPLALDHGVGFSNSSHAVSSSLVPFGSGAAGSQNSLYWKGINGSHQSCDWFVNGSSNQDLMVIGGSLPGNVKAVDIASTSNYGKPGCNGYEDADSGGATRCGELNFRSPVYRNALQDTDNPSNMFSQGCEMVSLAQHNARSEANNSSWPHPTYGNDMNALRISESRWNNVDTYVGDSTSRGLSLSLSSQPSPKINVAHYGEKFGSENLLSKSAVTCTGFQDLKANTSGCLYADLNSPIASDGYGNSVRGIVSSSNYSRRNIGPLGPFTGYATILNNSKFLKPAQQLLDDICCIAGSKMIKRGELSESVSREISISSNFLQAGNDRGRRGGDSAFSSSSFDSSKEAVGEGGLGSGSCQTYRPGFQQKKAKLLYMREEVCRRYRQYHQQMQMVVSSFESVVGLSSATPYTSLALKTVSRNFRFLKNAISDQLKQISKALGEDLLSPSFGTSNIGDVEIPRFRCNDQNLTKQKAGFDQPPIWRPQRGLPERAVSVLRAWLFEHFLHPYPTDTDKHMLASQTGLTRNQVSNWFINARVRVWKPMVEEMHMLESNGCAETELNSSESNQKPDTNIIGQLSNQSSDKQQIDQVSDNQQQYTSGDAMHAEDGGQREDVGTFEQWSREKRTRMECQTTDVDGGLIGFHPYHRGLGAVSLTLGLRHSTDQQQQQHEHQLRHYGSQMIHDFVG